MSYYWRSLIFFGLTTITIEGTEREMARPVAKQRHGKILFFNHFKNLNKAMVPKLPLFKKENCFLEQDHGKSHHSLIYFHVKNTYYLTDYLFQIRIIIFVNSIFARKTLSWIWIIIYMILYKTYFSDHSVIDFWSGLWFVECENKLWKK